MCLITLLQMLGAIGLSASVLAGMVHCPWPRHRLPTTPFAAAGSPWHTGSAVRLPQWPVGVPTDAKSTEWKTMPLTGQAIDTSQSSIVRTQMVWFVAVPPRVVFGIGDDMICCLVQHSFDNAHLSQSVWLAGGRETAVVASSHHARGSIANIMVAVVRGSRRGPARAAPSMATTRATGSDASRT